MSPVGLADLLGRLPRSRHPDLLVGFETGDDACVYRLSAEQALVCTVDYITPPVDDPRVFGEVASANALSDVYAMGGRPLSCLSLVGFPSDKLGIEVLEGILRGALDKVTEAGAVLGGGHTVEDEEPKFGLAVTGVVHPERIWRNVGARPGDRLILTKPIGSGVILNGNRKGLASPPALEACLQVMRTLNRAAAEALQAFSVHAATDVTGFGLAGHALGMAEGSGVTLRFRTGSIPVLDQALALYERGVTTRANGPNRTLVEGRLRLLRRLSAPESELLVDPQTNGGLLVSIPADRADAALAALAGAGVAGARLVGEVAPRGEAALVFE